MHYVPQISDILVSEIRDGIEGSGGVRCGVIGEMGCSYPLTAMEEKCLKAAALAQQKTGTKLYFAKSKVGCSDNHFDLSVPTSLYV